MSNYLYLPPRAATLALDEFQSRISSQTPLIWGVPSLDKIVRPAKPGDLITILGMPGNGKTTIMMILAKLWEEVVARDNTNAQDNIIVYYTLETLVEEVVGLLTAKDSGYSLADIDRGTADINKVSAACASLVSKQIAVVGSSKQEMMKHGMTRPPSLHDLKEALDTLKGMNKVPRAIFVDYLQKIDRDFSGKGGIERVSSNLSALKSLAISYGCPLVVGSQVSKRHGEVDQYWIPGLGDGQWSSAIEHDSDQIFGISYVGRNIPNDEIGSFLSIRGMAYEITRNTMLIRLNKQRWGDRSNTHVFVVLLDPANFTLVEQADSGPWNDDVHENPFE